jgi:hypothetical protein
MLHDGTLESMLGKSFRRRFAQSAMAISLAFSSTIQANVGDLVIQRKVLDSEIRLEASARFAGAVSSLTFRGKEYVDIRDHGRELQSAASFDGLGECFNPTEAGNAPDSDGESSSSKLLRAKGGRTWIETEVDMAFWLPPEFDYKKPCNAGGTISHSVNKSIRNGYLLKKRISLGSAKEGNVISDRVSYVVPEAHKSGTFEAVTLYTPSEFTRRYILNLANESLESTNIFGEQEFPVILATADGSNAVGLYSPQLPQMGRGYGSFSFANTQKINCVFREVNISAQEKFSYGCFLAVGSLAEVKDRILALRKLPSP